jgi:hypothetical protein
MKHMSLALLAFALASNSYATAVELKEKVKCTDVTDVTVFDKDGRVVSEQVDFKVVKELTRTTLKQGDLEIRTVQGVTLQSFENEDLKPTNKYSTITKVETSKRGAIEVVTMDTTIMTQLLGESTFSSGLKIRHAKEINSFHYLVNGDKKTLVKIVSNGVTTGTNRSVQTVQVAANKIVETTTLNSPEVMESGDLVVKTTKMVQVCESTEI